MLLRYSSSNESYVVRLQYCDIRQAVFNAAGVIGSRTEPTIIIIQTRFLRDARFSFHIYFGNLRLMSE